MKPTDLNSSIKKDSTAKKQHKKTNKLSKYIFGSIIGEGASATVFKAKNLVNNKIVAIKEISQLIMKNDEYLKKLFLTQGAVLKACNNPNVVKCYETIITKRKFYLVLQYCKGGDLADYLDKKKRLPEQEAITILKQILNGFRGLHEVGVMHRDFKLENVLIHNGVYKICDLGYAKQDQQQKQYFNSHQCVNSRVVSNAILGTSVNMAPQVHEGKHYGFSADIWSIGIAYYQLLYGKYPYDGQSDEQILNQILNKALRFNTKVKVSDESKDFIKRCLAREPQDRIKWRQIYDHPLINPSKKGKKGKESKSTLQTQINQETEYSENYKINKQFYENTPLRQKTIEATIQTQNKLFENSQSELQPKPKTAEDQILLKYGQIIEKASFGYFFIDKIAKKLPKSTINHHIPCFLLMKQVYLNLKNISTLMNKKEKLIELPTHLFNTFKNTEEYKSLTRNITTIKESVKSSWLADKVWVNSNICPVIIKNQKDLSQICSKNYRQLLVAILLEYEKMLINSVLEFPESSKKEYFRLILGVRYYRTKTNHNINQFREALKSIEAQKMQNQIMREFFDEQNVEQ